VRSKNWASWPLRRWRQPCIWCGVVIELLDFVQARGLPAAALRVRMALDVIDRDARPLAGEGAARVTLASVRIDTNGRAQAPACATHDHLATLLWEILAGRVAESDELPWSDPADDLPSGVLDTLASLTVRPANDFAELRRRFGAGIRTHASSHEEVLRALTASGGNPITLRAPAIQIEALRTLSATEAAQPSAQDKAASTEAASTEHLIPTRVFKVVSLPVVVSAPEPEPVAINAVVADHARTTMDPWNASPLNPEPAIAATGSAAEERVPPRRRTWPIVAACLAAAVALIVVASQRRTAPAMSAAAPATTSEALAPSAVSLASAASPAPADPGSASAALSVATASAPPRAVVKTPVRITPRKPMAPAPAPPADLQLPEPATEPPPLTEPPPIAEPPKDRVQPTLEPLPASE